MLRELSDRAGVTTRMITAENPTGGKGQACRAEPNPEDPALYWSKNSRGKGWKVCPFVRLEAGETLTVADIHGSGRIEQIFFTSDKPRFSELILRIYWDEEETPSVECPLGAFFCMGIDSKPHNVSSLPVTVAPHRGMNCYWSMPYRKAAHIELENQGDTRADIVAFKVLYHEEPVAPDAAYFHAQYRQSVTEEAHPVHTILDGVRGSGVYVGTYLMWTVLNSGWWGEGEVKFYLDGDTEYPTLCDNGTEDYFGGAWNFGAYGVLAEGEQEFQSPFLGLPMASGGDVCAPKKVEMYRFHLQDCIGFSRDLRVTVDTIGWQRDYTRYKHLSEDVRSVAFWYQREPHAAFPALPGVTERFER